MAIATPWIKKKNAERRVEKIKGRSTQDINALGAFTKVNPRKFIIWNYYQVNSFMLEVCVPYEIVTIYYHNTISYLKISDFKGVGVKAFV